MSTAFPAPGAKLPLAIYDGTHYPEPTWSSMRHANYTIPDGSYSMPISLDAAQTFRFMIQYAAAPSAVTTIEIAPDPVFVANQTQVLDTIPAAASTERTSFWTTAQGVAYSGQARIHNTSGVSITGVFVQEQVSSTGGNAV